MKKLLILGAGGHGKVVADCALCSGAFGEVAFLDDGATSQTILGFPVLGAIRESNSFRSEFDHAFVAIGNNSLRMELIQRLKKEGYEIPVLVHPSAVVSKFSSIEQGTIVLAHSVVSVGAVIGQGCIINTQASVDHDCRLENGVHVSPGAHLGGTVTVGEYTWICVGASIANNIAIGSNAVIAGGAMVNGHVPEGAFMAGVPAVLKEKKQDRILKSSNERRGHIE